MEKNSLSKDIKFALEKSMAIMPSYIVLGIGFGVMMSDAGYSWIWPVLMSVAIFGGSLQFAAVGLLSSGASVLTTAIITLTIHARQFIYSLSMLDRYKGMGKLKLYLIYGLVDESYSLVSSDSIIPKNVNKKPYYVFVTLFDQIWWVIGCAAGGLLGPIIPFDTTGIDFAMTALFVVLLLEQILNNKERRPAYLGIGVTFLSLLIFGEEIFLIPAIIVITFVLVMLRGKIKIEEEGEE
ncbi:MAG: AzlC family ABC transporter permease [Firmicutes bacterium]|nr:branched-chain amino acid transporter AzlC [Clostridiales bacterium]MBQ4340719.1 AzlC family ABC transporter permease [Bacillota bacterium]